MTWAHTWDRLLQTLLQPRCAACDRMEPQAPICEACEPSLTEVGTACPTCAEPIDADRALPCRRCARGRPVSDGVVACWRYGGAVAEALRRLKFQRLAWVARALAPLYAPQLGALLRVTEADLLTFVPLHWRRRAWRGFDQSALLASQSATRTVEATLRRVRATAPQSDLPARPRARNVANAFAVLPRATLAGRRVVIVDDVTTTGATLDACARALRAAGAREVWGFAIAKAEHPS